MTTKLFAVALVIFYQTHTMQWHVATSAQEKSAIQLPSMASLQGLPPELKVHIIVQLPKGLYPRITQMARTILALASTNKAWYNTFNNETNMMTILTSLPYDVQAIDLHTAMRKMKVMKNARIVQWIEEKQKDLEKGKELFEAIYQENNESVKVLLTNKTIDLNCRVGLKSVHALEAALMRKNLLITHMLLVAGANPNASKDKPILAHAIEKGNRTFIETLLTAGANPNAKIRERRRMIGVMEYTMLQLTMETMDTHQLGNGLIRSLMPGRNYLPADNYPEKEILQLLLEAGANPNFKDCHNKSARTMAKNRPDILRLFDEAEKS